MSRIKLVIGLGNPGTQYQNTRHNAGFWLIDELAKSLGFSFSFQGKYLGEVSRLNWLHSELLLLKPQTFMNLSGKSVQSLASFYKIDPNEILVIHDELDFKPGIVKLKFGGGNGGHNGLKDIDRVLGKDYWRLRVGIGHPLDALKVPHYVLSIPSINEKVAIDAAQIRVLKVFDQLIQGQFAAVQKELHSFK